MLEENLTIDGKEYTIKCDGWHSDILREAAAQLESGILYYKQSKDELSAHVLAALAFAYDSVYNSKKTEEEKPLQEITQNTLDFGPASPKVQEEQKDLWEVLGKISKYIHTDTMSENAA